MFNVSTDPQNVHSRISDYLEREVKLSLGGIPGLIVLYFVNIQHISPADFIIAFAAIILLDLAIITTSLIFRRKVENYTEQIKYVKLLRGGVGVSWGIGIIILNLNAETLEIVINLAFLLCIFAVSTIALLGHSKAFLPFSCGAILPAIYLIFFGPSPFIMQISIGLIVAVLSLAFYSLDIDNKVKHAYSIFSEVNELRAELQKKLERETYMAHHDFLTGLSNRRSGMEYMQGLSSKH